VQRHMTKGMSCYLKLVTKKSTVTSQSSEHSFNIL